MPTTSSPGPAGIMDILRNNANRLADLKREIANLPPGDPRRATKRAELKQVEIWQKQWKEKYRQATGSKPILLPEVKLPKETVIDLPDVVYPRSEWAKKPTSERQQLDRLIQVGVLVHHRLRGTVDDLYRQSSEIDWTLVFSILKHGTRVMGGANIRLLVVMRDQTLPQASRALQAARSALNAGDLATAKDRLREASKALDRVGHNISFWQEQIGVGAQAMELSIKFYAAVLTTIAGGSASLSLGQSMLAGGSGAAAGEVTTLLTKLDGEEISSEDLTKAAVAIASGALAPAAGSGAGALVKRFFRGMAQRLPMLLATKALEKWKGPVLTPVERIAAQRAAMKWVEGRIKSLGSSHFNLIAAKLHAHLTAKKKIPEWSFWTSVMVPLIGGVPGEVLKQGVESAKSAKN